MRVFCRYAYSRQNRRCERNKNKCLAGSKPCSHNQMMNMLAIRGKGAHPFTQTAIHNRHHIHQWNSDNP
ncbi:Uncharacterised protein [Salmonella enterica subsp. enterica serovar Typhimurium str. DT104]|nr:Uncharacterised protein [Salmonella enterica subsp. enterica serovar Typhimurium str. DT104]